jgi:hypothetical protein
MLFMQLWVSFYLDSCSTRTHHQASGNSDAQLSLADLHRVGEDGLGGRAVYFITVKRVGGFAHAAALDGFGSRHVVQPAVSQVGAPVVKRLVLLIFPENNQNPYRQALPLEPDGRARSGQLRNPVQADGQLSRFIVPAAFVLRSGCGGDAENPLPNTTL